MNLELISPNGALLKPHPLTQTMKVYAAMCVHREVKVQVFRNMRILEKCPNPRFEFKIMEGDALITRSRSRIATQFLRESEFSHILFLDDDVLYDPLDLRNMMLSMKENDLDILGAAYVTKSEEKPNFAIRTLEAVEDIRFGTGEPITEVRMVSAGCMAIHRRVLEKMVESEYVHLCSPQTYNYYPFFKDMEREIDGVHLHLSEEWALCEAARDLGFRIWLDPSIKLGHVGNKIFDWDDLPRPAKQVYKYLDWKVRIQKQ